MFGKPSPYRSKPIYCFNNNKIYSHQQDLVKVLRLNSGAVSRTLRGEYRQTKGYQFRYLTDLEIKQYYTEGKI